MKLSQLKTTPSQKNKKKPGNLLAKKWQAIQRQINQNNNLEKKIKEFSALFEKRMGDKEAEFVNKRGELVAHFCSFIPKKTLKDNALEDLFDYIDEELDLISHHPYTDKELPQALLKLKMQKYQERLDKFALDPRYISSLNEYLDSFPWLEHDLSEEELSEFIRNPEKVDEFIEQQRTQYIEENNIDEADLEDLDLAPPEDDMDEEEILGAIFKDIFGDDVFEDDEFVEGAFEGDAFEGEESEYHQHKATTGREDSDELLKKLMKSEEINKVYKKLANMLHPDKLRDKSKQAEYLGAMKELINARKAKDLFGLLSLAQRYMPDHELALDKKQEKQLSEALDRKLGLLKEEYHAKQRSDNYETVIWNKFQNKNKRHQEAHFIEHEKWLNSMNRETERIIATTNNIKNMKAFLRDVHNENYLHMMNELSDPFGFDDGFDDVFNDKDDFPF